MDDFRGKEGQTDNAWNIAVIFANGSGKLMDIGKLTAVDQCLPTERFGKIGDDRLIEISIQLYEDNHIQLLSMPIKKYPLIGIVTTYYDLTDAKSKEKLRKLLDAHRKSDE